MERTEAIATLRQTCNQLSASVTSMHPVVPKLAAPAAQGEILKALFDLTKNIEVVKKHLIRLEKGDDSTLL
jgi:hypothetical protein